ncbi:MAG: GFA family protein [Myxococcales bacterium]|nr:GFA family protein [Myxococcales bacterium]
MKPEPVEHRGGCHCGAVTFSVRAPRAVRVQRCNCSLCEMLGYEHLIVPARDFTLLTGRDALSTYTFNTGTAKHHFCRHCGVKSFYVPRSNPDGYSVNLRCVDRATFDAVTYEDFDGQQWEASAPALAHLSR